MRIKGGFQIIRTLFRSYANFPDHSHSFQIIWTHCLDLPDTFRIIRKLSRLSRHTSRSSRLFLDYPDTFFRLSRHFLDCPEFSSSSGHFAYYLDILYCKVSGNSSANNELVAKTFRICKNFPVSIADALTGFLRLWVAGLT